MTERLTEKIIDKKTGKVLAYENKRGITVLKAMQKLGEYETAEKDGRLIVLPCKVGDTMYVLRQSWNGWNIDKKKFSYAMIGKVGKTVFLTSEEAEKALKEMNKNE